LIGLHGRPHVELADLPAQEARERRRSIRQVLAAVADARAASRLERVFDDRQAHASVLTPAHDRERLILALPVFRGIVAAHRQWGQAPAEGAAGHY